MPETIEYSSTLGKHANQSRARSKSRGVPSNGGGGGGVFIEAFNIFESISI